MRTFIDLTFYIPIKVLQSGSNEGEQISVFESISVMYQRAIFKWAA